MTDGYRKVAIIILISLILGAVAAFGSWYAATLVTVGVLTLIIAAAVAW